MRHRSILLVAPLALFSCGCIALNIPSERLHDPADHGGPLGHWRGGFPGPGGEATDAHGCSAGGACGTPLADFDGGPLPIDDHREEKKDSESVPWPRFHPVPTRPIFE